jgi:alkanesulfonate monooxygenase SsuD/methylene tetrahydromethanopterin reductase-like flavin-dependent oxidoreductase (luciferase family)
MDEMMTIMRDFWDDGVAEFHGACYDFAAAGQFPVPSQRIPLWTGGKSPAALRRAARSDGWLGMVYPHAEIRALLARLAQERSRYLDGGGADFGFRKFVLSDEMPEPAACRRLEDLGIDGLVTRVWKNADPAYATLEAKLDAMQAFAEKLGLRKNATGM